MLKTEDFFIFQFNKSGRGVTALCENDFEKVSRLALIFCTFSLLDEPTIIVSFEHLKLSFLL